MNNNWVANDLKHVWHPFTQHFTASIPLAITKAKGAILTTEDGNEYIDANSSWWVNTHGHGHPVIGAALTKQFEEIDHVIFAGCTHPKATELATRLCEKMGDKFQRVFFSDNGSTAVEVALKMAIQYWYNKKEERPNFIALQGAYHGDTFGAMSVGERDLFNRPFEPYFFEVHYLGFPSSKEEERILERAKRILSSRKVAGLIVEPLVQGASGMRMYSVDFLDKLTSLAKKYGTLVIFDEVMTGFGRTGELFAMNHCETKPDIVTLSKGLTAGVLPMGLTVTSNAIYETFLSEEMSRGFLHGHSFTGNPLACAAACANLDLFEQDETWENINRISDWNRAFSSRISSSNLVAEIRQLGTILAIELKDEVSGYYSPLRDAAYSFFLERGVLIRPLGNVIFINAPYCTSNEELDKVGEAIYAFLQLLDQ